MKSKRISIFLMMVISFIAMPKNIFALTNFYQNSNGVVLNEKEYDFFSKMYWDGYQKFVTLDEYTSLKENGFFNQDIESKKISEPIMPLSTGYETGSKILQISKVCASNCFVAITASWKTIPKVKSYDVIGALLTDGVSRDSTPSTKLYAGSNTYSSSEIKYSNNGFGVSIKLPSTNETIKITQTFYAKGSGTIYASYQHATSNIALANSKSYNINYSGYGRVFDFYGKAYGIYDGMGGVDINI